MNGNPVKTNSFNEDVLQGFGQKTTSPGSLFELTWSPRFNQGSLGAYNMVGGNEQNVVTGPEFNFTVPGGDFFINPASSTGYSTVSGTSPIDVAQTGSGPFTHVVSISTDSTDWGSGSGTVGGAVTTIVENTIGTVAGTDLLRLTATDGEIAIGTKDASGFPDFIAQRYVCEKFKFITESNVPKVEEIETGRYYHMFSRNSVTDYVDNRPTLSGTTAVLTGNVGGAADNEKFRSLDINTLVMGIKFQGGNGFFDGPTWFGTSLPNFDTTCT